MSHYMERKALIGKNNVTNWMRQSVFYQHLHDSLILYLAAIKFLM